MQSLKKSKCSKTIIGKLERKKDNDVNADVAQREHSNIKRYASVFSNI